MQIISESTNGIAIAYSCSVGEIWGYTELGVSYTYSLLQTSLQWNESQNDEVVLSISDAHNLAHNILQ